MSKLNREEKEILDAFESEKLRRTKDAKNLINMESMPKPHCAKTPESIFACRRGIFAVCRNAHWRKESHTRRSSQASFTSMSKGLDRKR